MHGINMVMATSPMKHASVGKTESPRFSRAVT